MRNLTVPTRQQRKLSRLHLGDLPPEAKHRLRWFDWHEAHGRNVSLTCRYFGISRQTFYRWQARFDRWDLSSLADCSSRPKKLRQRSWTTEEVLAIKALRERFPFWGKMKLVILLAVQGLTLPPGLGASSAISNDEGSFRSPWGASAYGAAAGSGATPPASRGSISRPGLAT